MDTPVINGTAYPYIQVEPKAYRFRILNACNDRNISLGLVLCRPGQPDGGQNGARGTECRPSAYLADGR